MTSIDRAGAVVGLISLWEDENALEASEGVAADSRAEAVRMIGGDVKVETFEQVVGEIGSPPPTEGCLVRFVSFQTDAARVDENIAFFKAEVLPAMTGSPGFRAVRHLIDAVLLTHDHHDDNLDPAGRTLLPSAGAVVTTVSGSKRLGGKTRGLEPWATTMLEASGRPPIEITATPCRHGPPLSRPLAGDVIGFALSWGGQEHGVLWISGDTVLYNGVREVADRVQVEVALLHLGGVQFPVTGPVQYTLTAKDAVELCRLIRPRTAIPIHYEGWKHFKQGREEIERELARAPEDIRRSIRWLPLGVEVELPA